MRNFSARKRRRQSQKRGLNARTREREARELGLLDEHRANHAGGVVNALARTKAHCHDEEFLGKPIARAYGRNNSSSRRRYQLAPHVKHAQGNSVRAHNVHHGGHRHGDDAVLAAHRSLALGQVGHHDLVNSEVIKANGESEDVGYGINRPHLVEMHLFNRLPVRLRLGIGDYSEYVVGYLLGACVSA